MSDGRIPDDPAQPVFGCIDNLTLLRWKLYVVSVFWGEKRFGPWYTFKPIKALDLAHDHTKYVKLLKQEVLGGV